MDPCTITLTWSDEDQVFVAEAPGLPGCMAHGASRHEALISLREDVALWLETATAANRPPPPEVVAGLAAAIDGLLDQEERQLRERRTTLLAQIAAFEAR
ncbi:MAG: type II toxin-antitoxin system HicB family antitoxin [Candidatus Latescibacterota bacterium]